MQDSNTPIKIPLPFAASAAAPYINPIPTASQIGVTNGAASFTDGFPPLTFVPISSGGAGPFGKDFNGLLYQITGGLQWLQAGAPLYYDVGFSAAIGGYPKGTLLSNATTLGSFWLSEVDNNTTNPDTGGANWLGLLLPTIVQADTTFYANYSTGSDSTGTGTVGNPWKTVQYAWNKLFNTLNGSGHSITINQDGADPGGLSATGAIAGVETLNIILNGSLGGGIIASSGARLDVSGTGAVSGSAFGWCVIADAGGFLRFQGITLGTAPNAKVGVGRSAAVVVKGNYVDGAGGSALHFDVGTGNLNVFPAAQVTQNGAAYSTAFARSWQNGNLRCDTLTFAGTPSTGSRYTVSTGGGLYLNGATLPGSAGTVDAATYGWVVA